MTPNLHKWSLARRARLFERVPGLEALDALMASAPDLVFCVKDHAGRYLAANPAFLARTGLAEIEMLLGKTARDLFPGSLAVGYEQQDEYVFGTGEPIRDRLELVTNPHGGTGWYVADKVPVRDRRGVIVALAGVSRDLHADAADRRLGRLASAVDRIRREFATPLRIANLARDAGLSISRFERLMRSTLLVSPRQLITQLRIEAAVHLLRTTELDLLTVALQCGFCDQPTFCRQFKIKIGESPGRYRRQVNSIGGG